MAPVLLTTDRLGKALGDWRSTTREQFSSGMGTDPDEDSQKLTLEIRKVIARSKSDDPEPLVHGNVIYFYL